MTSQHLLQVVKSAVAATDHVASGGPLSVHVLICPLAGTRARLHEYSNMSPASHCRLRASAGIVTALVWASTGVAQTKQRKYCCIATNNNNTGLMHYDAIFKTYLLILNASSCAG